jgi:hypothetical protein
MGAGVVLPLRSAFLAGRGISHRAGGERADDGDDEQPKKAFSSETQHIFMLQSQLYSPVMLYT